MWMSEKDKDFFLQSPQAVVFHWLCTCLKSASEGRIHTPGSRTTAPLRRRLATKYRFFRSAVESPLKRLVVVLLALIDWLVAWPPGFTGIRPTDLTFDFHVIPDVPVPWFTDRHFRLWGILTGLFKALETDHLSSLSFKSSTLADPPWISSS